MYTRYKNSIVKNKLCLESELKLESLVVKLTPLFGITQQQISYCKEQTVFPPQTLLHTR